MTATETKPETEKPKRGRPRKAIDAPNPTAPENSQETAGDASATENVPTIHEPAAIAPRPISGDSTASATIAIYDPREPEAVAQVAPLAPLEVDPYTRDLEAWRKKLQAKSDNVKGNRAEVERIKGELKEAKQLLDASLTELERLVDADPEKNPLPLFDPPKAVAETKPRTVGTSEAWRETSIDDLDLVETAKEKLRSAGIDTVGKLADWVAPNKAGFCRLLTDIDGVGPSTADKIDEALVAFWSTRPAETPPVVAEAAGPVEDDDEAEFDEDEADDELDEDEIDDSDDEDEADEDDVEE